MQRANRRMLSVVLGAMALLLAGQAAEAQTKPFKIVGAGVGEQGLPVPGEAPRSHWAVGVATGLGVYAGEGTVQTDTLNVNNNGTITGQFGGGSPFVFLAANGDKLATWYGKTAHGASTPGTYTLTILDVLDDGSVVVEAAWIAEFVVQPNLSTGRFAGATGSWVMYAYSEPFTLHPSTANPYGLESSEPVVYSWQGQGKVTFPRGNGQ